jgi:hypothetical protein
MKWLIVAAVLGASIASSASAAPSVFVRPAGNGAWWLAEMEGRVLQKAAGPITAEAVSAHILETTIYDVYTVCSLEAVGNDTFVGLDRQSQEEIDLTETAVRWRIDTVTAEGRAITAQSVIYEACDDDEKRGAALLVSDASTNKILRWIPIGPRYVGDDKIVPTWVLFLLPPEGDELFGYSGCSECGARTDVYYDGRRQHIYVEYNGH